MRPFIGMLAYVLVTLGIIYYNTVIDPKPPLFFKIHLPAVAIVTAILFVLEGILARP